MTERLMTEVEEDFLRKWFIDDDPSLPHPLIKVFPFAVEIEDIYSAGSYCFKMFGKRFFNFGNNKRVEFNHSARWDMYIFPRFRTEEDAVMFRLGYPGK
jgi:hypothetical protein